MMDGREVPAAGLGLNAIVDVSELREIVRTDNSLGA